MISVSVNGEPNSSLATSYRQPRLTEFFLASPSRCPSVISVPIRSWPVPSRPGLSSASMFVPMRYWETRSRLVPLRGPLAAPAPHGGFLRPWFLGFEAPHPPPAAVVDSAWVPRRRDTPQVFSVLLLTLRCSSALFCGSKIFRVATTKTQNIAVLVSFRKF